MKLFAVGNPSRSEFSLFSKCRFTLLKSLAPLLALLGFAAAAVAQTNPPPDYTNALWNQAYPGHWYTNGYGHFFCVIHDMEGYYESTISYFQQATQNGSQASIYYCVNSLHNGSDNVGHAENNPNDAPIGEITQMVREQYWAWHVSCWNEYMFGTEHEGFVDTPAWYSETMYQVSAKLQQHLCNAPNASTPPIPEDRNHIIGHDEWQNPAWTAWMATNWPAIDTTCNDHTDPGQYWNWTHFMQLLCMPTFLGQPTNLSVIPGTNATFSISTYNTGTNNPTSYQWMFNGTNVIPGATASSLTITNVQMANAGTYSVVLSNAYNLVSSSNALLTVLPVLQIGNVIVNPEPTGAIITWTTSTNATAQVFYGTTPGYGSLTTLDTNLVTSHVALLSGLTGGTTYYFQIEAASGTNQASATGSFTPDGSVIVQALQASYSGVWTIESSAPDKYSGSYKYAGTTTGSDSAEATFQPNILTPGNYDVSIWYSEGANRSTNVPVLIADPPGYSQTTINQSVPGGAWRLLVAGQYYPAGNSGFVRIGNGTGESNKVVIADAVQWAYSPGQDSVTNGNVPGWWANFFYGATNVSGSATGSNGLSLLDNYVLGLVPTNPASQLTFRAAPLKPGVQFTFSPWLGGRHYGLQAAANLSHPVWTNVSNLTVTQNSNGQGTITLTNTVNARAFYRLSAQVSQ